MTEPGDTHIQNWSIVCGSVAHLNNVLNSAYLSRNLNWTPNIGGCTENQTRSETTHQIVPLTNKNGQTISASQTAKKTSEILKNH